MDGVHDMGGMHGFGSVDVDDDAQFHADWERTVFGLVRATRAAGVYNIDESRHGIERMDPAAYLESTYFERWLASLERNLAEKGVVTPAEVESTIRGTRPSDGSDESISDESVPDESVSDASTPDGREQATAERVRTAFERPASFDRPGGDHRFDEGDAVRVHNVHPSGHTRCPRYVRRCTGTVERSHGNYVFPDANAHGEERAEPLYTVAFDAGELWGPDAENPTDTVAVDLWEPYLRPASNERTVTDDDSPDYHESEP